MQARTFGSGSYKYGFNGKENDRETVSTGDGTQDYGMRIYNPSLGKFLSVDPLTKKYPELTPYQFASNTPVQAIDLDGQEEYHYLMTLDKNGKTHLQCTSVKYFNSVSWFGLFTTHHKIEIPRYVVNYGGKDYYIGFASAKGSGNNTDEAVKAFESFSNKPNALLFPLMFSSEENSYGIAMTQAAQTFIMARLMYGKGFSRQQYKFEKAGYSYRPETTKGTNGSLDITHYIVKGEEKIFCGYLNVDANGTLSNAFEVPDGYKSMGISKAAYYYAFSLGIKSIHASLMQDNFNAFKKAYNPETNNAVEAIYNTPAGKVLKGSFEPVNIKINEKSVDFDWKMK